MLKELEIKDFALVEHVRVPFTAGFNVLTGETGAGKSIIMDALSIGLGGKCGPSVIRPGAEKSTIEITLGIGNETVADAAVKSWLKERELLEHDETEFAIAREISRTGSKIRINGTIVGLSLVAELRTRLLTVHAQHEARTLLSPQSQLEMLDSLGDAEHRRHLARVRTVYARRKELESQLQEKLASQADRERRLDFARFQLNELEGADLRDPAEDELIASQRKVLSSVAELESLLANALAFLRGRDQDGDPGAIDLVNRALGEVGRAAAIDDGLEKIALSLGESAETLEEGCRWIRKYCQGLESDPETLSRLEERSAVLSTVKRKYGPTLEEAVGRRDCLAKEIVELETVSETIEELRAELDEVREELGAETRALSVKRKALAKKLAAAIETELVDLGMEKCKFEIAVVEVEEGESGPTGIDRVDFLIAPNPGQPPMPVAKIASGGEMSRVMLAVKSIFAEADQVATVIFDEIDTGLSGRVLQSMRDKLARLARSHQILCITHQPILASVADNHVSISKEQSASTTRTVATVLGEPERIKALAAMASGYDDQEAALKFARSLYQDGIRARSL